MLLLQKLSKDKNSCPKAREAAERHISKMKVLKYFYLRCSGALGISKSMQRGDLSSREFSVHQQHRLETIKPSTSVCKSNNMSNQKAQILTSVVVVKQKHSEQICVQMDFPDPKPQLITKADWALLFSSQLYLLLRHTVDIKISCCAKDFIALQEKKTNR